SLQPVTQAAAGQPASNITASEYLIIAIPPADSSDQLPWLQTWMQAAGVLITPQFQNTHVMVVTSSGDIRNSMRELPTSLFTITDSRSVDGLIRQLRMDAGSITLLRRTDRDRDVGQVLLNETVTNSNT